MQGDEGHLCSDMPQFGDYFLPEFFYWMIQVAEALCGPSKRSRGEKAGMGTDNPHAIGSDILLIVLFGHLTTSMIRGPYPLS